MSYYIDLVERIKRELSIDSLLPKEAVGKRSICCPLPDHNDHGPSFTVYRETNSWICWSHPGGRSAGSVLDYIMAERGVPFKEAVAIGADILGIEIQPPTEEERFEMERWRRREDILTTLARVSNGWLMGESDTAKDARAYLEGRGFGPEFMKEHRLGLVDIRKLYDIRPKHPLLSDYTAEQFDELGLRTWDEEKQTMRPLFYRARIAIPLMRRSRVVGYTFRDLEDGKPKYMHLPGIAGVYNEDALAHREVCLTEGVPDCWTLMQWGIHAVGNLGVHAVKHAQRFRNLTTLTIVWDNDEAGRKNVLPTAKAIQAEMKDGEVRILHMPGEKDINAWAMAGGTAEEFKGLVADAPSLLEYMIDLLPELRKGEMLDPDGKQLLDDVLRFACTLDEIRLEHSLKTVSNRLKVSLATLRKTFAGIQKEECDRRDAEAKNAASKPDRDTTWTPIEFYEHDIRPYIAALDFDLEADPPRANMGVWMRPIVNGERGGPDKYVLESRITESQLTMDLVHYSERQIDDPKLLRFPGETFPKWSSSRDKDFSITAFRRDPSSCIQDTGLLFSDIRSLFRDYIWYPNEYEYDVLACWILMTYVFPIFGSVGYLHFHGGSGSGKSMSQDFIELLAFNVIKSSSLSESVLFHMAHENRGTMLFEEAERLCYPKPETQAYNQRLLIIDSYKEGSTARRRNMDNDGNDAFDVFGPKCFGSTREIDHIFANRCIVIQCLKKTKEESTDKKDSYATKFALQNRAGLLRNRLHCWALTRFVDVHKTFLHCLHHEATHLENRDREIWMPLLTIAGMADREGHSGTGIMDRLIVAQRHKQKFKEEKERRENIDIVVLQALLEILQGNSKMGLQVGTEVNWYPTAKLAAAVYESISEDGSWPFERKLTSSRFTQVLQQSHVVDESGLKQFWVAGKNARCVHLLEENLVATLARMMSGSSDADSPDPAPPTNPPAPSIMSSSATLTLPFHGFDDDDTPF